MSDTASYTSFKETYHIGKAIAGDYGGLYDRSLVFYIAAYICQGLAYLSLYLIFSRLLGTAAGAGSVWFWIAIFSFFTIINGACRWFAHDFDYTGTLPRVMHDMRVNLGEKLRTIPLERLFRYKTGELNSNLSSNVDESVTMLGMVSGMFFEIVITPTVVVTGMFFIDWRMALIMMAMLLLIIPLYRKKRRSGYEEKSGMGKVNAELESDIIEYIQGLPVLRATNQTGVNAKRLNEGIMTVYDWQKSRVWGSSVLMLASDMFILALLIVIGITGSFWVGTASMSIAAVASILLMVSRMIEPMSLFLAITAVLDIMSSSFRRVKEIQNIQPLKVHKPEREAERYSLSLESVDFCYHGQDQKALNNISIEVPNKAMTAIVGPSGSGKTTITKLMMRYADPQSGVVMIGDVDIRQMTQDHLLRHFAVVFQDVYLFDDSIIENIRMAKPDADDEEVENAARAAYCHEFITRLPEGYYTRVGDIGGSLSGGERQRISIARAILKDAPIVILDEPTAALDTESELAVQKAIDALVEDKTVIVIAHRLSTIAGADQILVVDEGRLAEMGTHQELLALNKRYYDLWQAQLRSKAWHIGDMDEI